MDDVTKYSRQIDQLFADGREKKYPKNQLIHYQEDPLSHIYLVKEGFIKAYTILESGDTRTILILGPGDIFPLAFSTSLDWDNYRLKYFYQSLTDSTVTGLSSSTFKDKVHDEPKMMEIYMNYMAASNNIIMEMLEVMKNKKAIDKIGLLLPYLISKVGQEVKPGVYQLQVHLSHQEIADLSGVTRETTTTLIKQLENEGVIDQRRGKWLINKKALEAFTPH